MLKLSQEARRQCSEWVPLVVRSAEPEYKLLLGMFQRRLAGDHVTNIHTMLCELTWSPWNMVVFHRMNSKCSQIKSRQTSIGNSSVIWHCTWFRLSTASPLQSVRLVAYYQKYYAHFLLLWKMCPATLDPRLHHTIGTPLSEHVDKLLLPLIANKFGLLLFKCIPNTSRYRVRKVGSHLNWFWAHGAVRQNCVLK